MKYRLTLSLAVLLLAACSGKDDPDNSVAPPVDMSGAPDASTDAAPDLNEPEPDLGPDLPAEPPRLVVDPEAVTFSDVRQGETASATIGLSNLGGSPLVVTGVQLTEFNRRGEPEFEEGDGWDDSFVLEPNTFKELTIVYAPKDYDLDQGALEFFTNDPDRDRVQVRIETVSAYSQLEGPTYLRFGDVEVGESATQRLTFVNRGLDALTIDSVELTGITNTFSVAYEPSATPPTVLERDEDFIVDVTYTPDTQTTHRGTLTLNTNAPATPTHAVALVGNDPTACLDITPDSIDLADAVAGTPATQQVTLLNCSTSLQLDVTAIALTDDGNGAFTIAGVPNVPLRLSPLQTAQFNVTAVLAAPGVATGSLSISSSDPSNSGVVPLRLTVPEP